MTLPASPSPLLSVVIVNWNTREVLRGCLATLSPHLAGVAYEAIVVDNGSSDGSADMVKRDFPGVRVVRNRENLGFGRANNIGMAAASGEFFLLLNSDARLTDGAVVLLLARLKERPEVGVVAPRIVHEDGRLQASARRFPSLGRLLLSDLWLHRLLGREGAAERLLGHYWDHSQERAVDWLVGACLLLRRKVFEDTGGFDPTMFLYGEEVEWCRRIRDRGWTVLFSPAGKVVHLDHRSADILLGTQGRIDQCLDAEDKLLRRWEGLPGRLAPFVRLTGALLRLAVFGARGLLRPGDAYARDVAGSARATIGHYLRRMAGHRSNGHREGRSG